jgi:hypothetical protein
MADQERGIVFTNDLDGVHFYGPPPWKSTRRFRSGNVELPPSGSPLGEYMPPTTWAGRMLNTCDLYFHQARPVRREALSGLADFQAAADEAGRELKIVALSGRDVSKHAMTRQRLLATRHMDYFSDTHLNTSDSASGWKEHVVREYTEAGHNVVHIDDDLWAGMRVAQVDADYPDEQRVVVYMMENISHHPKIVDRVKLALPENVVFVRSFRDAAKDFRDRLGTAEI